MRGLAGKCRCVVSRLPLPHSSFFPPQATLCSSEHPPPLHTHTNTTPLGDPLEAAEAVAAVVMAVAGEEGQGGAGGGVGPYTVLAKALKPTTATANPALAATNTLHHVDAAAQVGEGEEGGGDGRGGEGGMKGGGGDLKDRGLGRGKGGWRLGGWAAE